MALYNFPVCVKRIDGSARDCIPLDNMDRGVFLPYAENNIQPSDDDFQGFISYLIQKYGAGQFDFTCTEYIELDSLAVLSRRWQ